ncbi:hypothetical protein [Prosthecobacter sp.]|uniref:hypothetical protein n=1 Tax=Prosthecobacter sp. TaxID=1965333 RepID=UPI001DFFBC52|nr:hypothetical protein [Prosthecobacter sp.]MCB1278371.1 hypothetical protein [Prosthecobacter sp.]
MQVSWIDADHIKGLVAQIAPQGSSPDKESQVGKIETAPVIMEEPVGDSWGFAEDWIEPVSKATSVVEEQQVSLDQNNPVGPLEEPECESDAGLHNAAAALPLSRIRDKLRAIRQRATEAGILTRAVEVSSGEKRPEVPSTVSDVENESCGEGVVSTEAEVKPASSSTRGPAFEVPHGSRHDRLAAFAAWARQVLSEDGGHLLVMSDDGEVLWGGEAKAGLVLSTMMAWGAAIRASAVSACETPAVIRQPLASGNVLTVIPCETREGMIHAAVAAPAGLGDDQAQALREALSKAMQ